MTIVPACICRFTCEDVAECVSDLPDEVRTLLFSWGYRDIGDAWGYLTELERTEIAAACLYEEARCAELAEAIGL
jgi:hypothetical protein